MMMAAAWNSETSVNIYQNTLEKQPRIQPYSRVYTFVASFIYMLRILD